MLQRIRRTVVIAIPFVIGAANAFAQQPTPAPMPRQGEFSLTYTFVNPQPFETIPGADGKSGLVATNIAWLMNDEGAGFGHRMTGRCVAFQRLEGTTVVESRGNCVYTDADGDQLFEEFNREPGEPLSTGRWTGGTGKYAGVTSEFIIRGMPGFGGRTEAGYPVSAGAKTGSYQLPAQ